MPGSRAPGRGATITNRPVVGAVVVTPAIKILEAAGIAHDVTRYDASQAEGDYGIDASNQLGLSPDEVFKTLVAETDAHAFVVGIVPVSGRLDLKKLAAAVRAKKTFMADPAAVEKMTGYVLGGVSPLGQKKRLPTVIDASAQARPRIHVSGGRRGLEISLAPDDLAALTGAQFADIAHAQ
ncbi:YbaK/EbsC protein [Salinisphaera hydrothermalis C41B8]|uniref:Cys-tRNA(Pro)/Cys-tRNA(Cys) deacylase n=1 Tax=Salinisphaera hydrothermalis (strain C41B8) TaxID=1304275 RepID=A0A084IN02_SALHC|nr:YbaK/EbsC protein [Salinisphaera hydrothermalis C41B8]